MRKDNLTIAIAEAERFLLRARDLLTYISRLDGLTKHGEIMLTTAAARRASLDLSSALANLRRRDSVYRRT